jgi:hypothetical protein
MTSRREHLDTVLVWSSAFRRSAAPRAQNRENAELPTNFAAFQKNNFKMRTIASGKPIDRGFH